MRERLRDVDANLLLSLHALLEEKNLTHAGERMTMSQPAMSGALARLRKHFDDELLLRSGRRHELTPLAAELRPGVEDLIRRLGTVLAPTSSFEPEQLDREFLILASDYAATTVVGPLMRRMSLTAPGARVSLEPLPSSGMVAFREGYSRADGLVMPRGMPPPGDSLPLFTDEWCCLVDQDLAEDARTWTVDEFRARRWIVTETRGIVPALADLRHQGIEINVAARTQLFSAVPLVVAGTPHVGIVQRRLAEQMAGPTRTAIVDVPWQQPALHLAVYFDRLRAQDPAVRWMLNELVLATQTTPP